MGLVVATGPGALAVVAGVPLCVRGVLALRAAGAAEVAVFAGPQQRRVAALLARRCPEVPCLGAVDDAEGLSWQDPVLVVAGDVLFDGAALAPLLASARPGGIRLGIAAGSPPGEVHAAVYPASAMPALLAELGRTTNLRPAALGRRAGAPPDPPVCLADGLFLPFDQARRPAVLERALLDNLARRTTAKDSYLASLIDRRLSRPVTRLLLGVPVTPSQITLASILLGLVGAVGLATVSYGGRLAGVLALVASIVLDCVDGEIARARYQQSARGARLDVIGDYTVHLAVFVGLSVGLLRQGLPPGGAWAAGALIGGVAAAMVTMHRLFVQPALSQGGDLHWAGDAEGWQGTPVAAVVEKLASRDYTYVLLVLALAGHLEWFLYAAAVGAWAFVLGLVGYSSYMRWASPRPVESP